MKIGLQFASIEVYLIGFFLGVRSAFKGRIRSNLATIRDQPCLDWIAIKSRIHGGSQRTQYFPQKPLNSFMIQSRVELQRGRTPFYRRNRSKNRGPSNSVKADRRLRSCDYRGPRSHDLLIFCLSDEATCRAELRR